MQKLEKLYKETEGQLDKENLKTILNWKKKKDSYKKDYFVYKVRDKEIKI
ncbi:unnamed protein product, partial [marine sediment metagenome]